MTTATPTKLRNGNWGARVSGSVQAGDEITITTRAGKSWQAQVERVVWSGSGRDGSPAAIVATASVQSSRSSRYGSGYATGTIAPHGQTCSYCGSRECARAWNPRDLCDED